MNTFEKEKIQTIEQHYTNLDKMKQYTGQAIDILNSEADIREFGALLNDTWTAKKALSEKVTDNRINELYHMGLKNGAVGGKLLGAGGGGFMLFFVKPEQKQRLLAALKEYIHVPFGFENSGSQVIYYKPYREGGE